MNCEPEKVEYITNGSEAHSETKLKYKNVCMPILNLFFSF